MTSIRNHFFHLGLPGQSVSWKEQLYLMFCTCSLSVTPALFMTTTDQVNPGESYDLLLMSLVKSTLVYFAIEKAHDTMWREGLLIKLNGY